MGRVQDEVHGFRPRKFSRASELNDLASVIYVLLMFESVTVDSGIREGARRGFDSLSRADTNTEDRAHKLRAGTGARIRLASSSALKHMAGFE